MGDYLLLIDGSSLLSTQYFGNLPREILYAKKQEEKEAPEAYRSLSRPSSPPRAKASAMRPFLLSLSCLYTVKTTAYGSIYTFSSLLNLLFFMYNMSKIVSF